ncbi:DUF896 domain-containing protein [Defluviitalea saccharophila]|uniref:UPF0291 protein QBE51_00610 n=1 Tax=Defluviitalea saccharophila TaxID=879970 RepID=A0ABZ2Y608_9FIRM
MEDKKIKRINELYKKQKSVGLTEEEKIEQEQLRREYIELVKRNFRQTMGNVRIQHEDGTVTPLKSK